VLRRGPNPEKRRQGSDRSEKNGALGEGNTKGGADAEITLKKILEGE